MSEKLAEKVKSIIADKMGVSLDKVVDGAKFIDDLGADSLDSVELLMALEEEFDIEIPQEEGQNLLSVKDAIAFIEKKIGNA